MADQKEVQRAHSEKEGGAGMTQASDQIESFLANPSEFEFFNLLEVTEAEAIRFSVDVLHGVHGKDLANIAARAMRNGVGFGGDFDITLPIANYLLMEGRVDTIIAIVDAGPPHASLPVWGVHAESMLTKIEWLDLLCTNQEADAADAHSSFLAMAVWRSTCSFNEEVRLSTLRAIEYVWKLNQEHPDFKRIAESGGAEAGVIKAFFDWKNCTAIRHVS